MISFEEIFTYLRIILFALTALIALIYSIPILFIRRFQHRNNILTLNICLATICCSLYWAVFYTMLKLDTLGTFNFMLNSCTFVVIVPPLLTLQVPFSFVTASVNRFCVVIYCHTNLFKRKQWVFICILNQWIFGTLFTLPILRGIQPYCGTPQWVDIYKLLLIVIIPSIVFLVINILIYTNVRSSSRRVQPSSLLTTETNSDNTRSTKLSRRDLHLLRHMVVMYCIFVGGWIPLYTLLATQSLFLIDPTLLACFTIWCELALLCDIIDLYLYNHELRNYFKMIFLHCFQ